jgi:hypothetical protein
MPIPLQSDFDATQLRSFARKTKVGPKAKDAGATRKERRCKTQRRASRLPLTTLFFRGSRGVSNLGPFQKCLLKVLKLGVLV